MQLLEKFQKGKYSNNFGSLFTNTEPIVNTDSMFLAPICQKTAFVRLKKNWEVEALPYPKLSAFEIFPTTGEIENCKIRFRDVSMLKKYLYIIQRNTNYYLLFFAVYIIYKKNYSFSIVYSGVKFLFFYLTKTANFYSKINDSSMVRTTAFSSSRLWVRVSVVLNIFTIYP